MGNKREGTQKLRSYILGVELEAPHTAWEGWCKLPVKIAFWLSSWRRETGDHLVCWAWGEYPVVLESAERERCEGAASAPSAPTTTITLSPRLQKFHYFTMKHVLLPIRQTWNAPGSIHLGSVEDTSALAWKGFLQKSHLKERDYLIRLDWRSLKLVWVLRLNSARGRK